MFLKFPRFIREKFSQNILAPNVVKKLPVGIRGKIKTKTIKNEDKFTAFLFIR